MSGNIYDSRRLLRSTTEAFIACDADTDRALSFDEFVNMIPKELLAEASEETLRELFDSADASADGSVTQAEYFFFSLRWAAEASGGLSSAFSKFDSGDHDGKINLAEFTQAVSPYGFAEAAHHIFAELDRDGTGAIDYAEMLEAVRTTSLPLLCTSLPLLRLILLTLHSPLSQRSTRIARRMG